MLPASAGGRKARRALAAKKVLDDKRRQAQLSQKERTHIRKSTQDKRRQKEVNETSYPKEPEESFSYCNPGPIHASSSFSIELSTKSEAVPGSVPSHNETGSGSIV